MAASSNKWLIFGGVAAVVLLMTKRALGLNVKPGVILPTTPEMQYAEQIVKSVWTRYGYTATITSGIDGEHKEDSLHYSGLAEDFRTKDLPRDIVRLMVNETQAQLGNRYQVFLEYFGQANEHMHIEFDPH